MSAIAAKPKYERGQRVVYVDSHDRVQRGEVLSIEAQWPGWSQAGCDPYVYYRVWHPSYRNNQTSLSESGIRCLSTTPEDGGA